MERVIVLFTLGQFSTLLPFFLYNLLPKSIAKHTVTGKRADSLIGIREYLIAEVKSHQDNLDSKNPEDFIDVYLSQMDKEEDLNIMDLIACIHAFFVAGTETSSTTLKWILLYLTLHQDILYISEVVIISCTQVPRSACPGLPPGWRPPVASVPATTAVSIASRLARISLNMSTKLWSSVWSPYCSQMSL